jgi:hypothetical protein
VNELKKAQVKREKGKRSHMVPHILLIFIIPSFIQFPKKSTLQVS